MAREKAAADKLNRPRTGKADLGHMERLGQFIFKNTLHGVVRQKGWLHMIYEKSCGAVIYTQHDSTRLYLVEHMQKGHCSICKGHVEGNETEHQTAAREILEETGLTVTFLEGFRETIAYSPYENCMKTVVFFLARADSTAVTAQEAEVREIEWLPFAEAVNALTFASDRETLQKAEAFLQAACGRD